MAPALLSFLVLSLVGFVPARMRASTSLALLVAAGAAVAAAELVSLSLQVRRGRGLDRVTVKSGLIAATAAKPRQYYER
jgi:hypothetical protein